MSESGVNVHALYEALDAKRSKEKLSWRGLSQQLGIAPSTFSRMSQGKRPDVDTFAVLIEWLQLPVSLFMKGEADAKTETDSLAAIGTYLRADRNLTPRDAQAIEHTIRLLYASMASTSD